MSGAVSGSFSCQQFRACFLFSELLERSVGYSRLGRCVPCCRFAGLPICFSAHADFLAARSVPCCNCKKHPHVVCVSLSSLVAMILFFVVECRFWTCCRSWCPSCVEGRGVGGEHSMSTLKEDGQPSPVDEIAGPVLESPEKYEE